MYFWVRSVGNLVGGKEGMDILHDGGNDWQTPLV